MSTRRRRCSAWAVGRRPPRSLSSRAFRADAGRAGRGGGSGTRATSSGLVGGGFEWPLDGPASSSAGRAPAPRRRRNGRPLVLPRPCHARRARLQHVPAARRRPTNSGTPACWNWRMRGKMPRRPGATRQTREIVGAAGPTGAIARDDGRHRTHFVEPRDLRTRRPSSRDAARRPGDGATSVRGSPPGGARRAHELQGAIRRRTCPSVNTPRDGRRHADAARGGRRHGRLSLRRSRGGAEGRGAPARGGVSAALARAGRRARPVAPEDAVQIVWSAALDLKLHRARRARVRTRRRSHATAFVAKRGAMRAALASPSRIVRLIAARRHRADLVLPAPS